MGKVTKVSVRPVVFEHVLLIPKDFFRYEPAKQGTQRGPRMSDSHVNLLLPWQPSHNRVSIHRVGVLGHREGT